MFDGGGATEAIAAGIAERPAGEDDEGLRVAAEVAVPAALVRECRFQRMRELVDEFIVDLELDEGPDARLTGGDVSERPTWPTLLL